MQRDKALSGHVGQVFNCDLPKLKPPPYGIRESRYQSLQEMLLTCNKYMHQNWHACTKQNYVFWKIVLSVPLNPS